MLKGIDAKHKLLWCQVGPRLFRSNFKFEGEDDEKKNHIDSSGMRDDDRHGNRIELYQDF
jgi:hypothetical protein